MSILLAKAPRTGKVLFDTLLCALEGLGAEKITHDGKPGAAGSIIRCTYQKRVYVMHYSARPAPRKVSNVIDVFRHLGAIPREPKVKRVKDLVKHAA